MPNIQLDMFEVQLGASILIQARIEGQVVSVLADGGISASGYTADHVRRQLPIAMDAFEAGRRRIDLIIGTHYDRDHLDGLVPVIEDPDFEIGEAWMPPVLDDQDPPPRNRHLRDDDFLGEKLATGERLTPYVEEKLAVCREFERAYEEVLIHGRRHGGDRDSRSDEALRFRLERPNPDETSIERRVHQRDARVGDAMRELESHIREADVSLDHVGAVPGEPLSRPGELEPEVWRATRPYRQRNRGTRRPLSMDVIRRVHSFPDAPGSGALASLAFLRVGTAKDAINAVALDAVVSALRRRRTPTSYKVIEPGTPRTFAWDPIRRVFGGGRSSLTITLLGPSTSLVRKHADRLPIGTYALRALEFSIPVPSITPSNQLSYVARLDAHDQRVLVS